MGPHEAGDLKPYDISQSSRFVRAHASAEGGAVGGLVIVSRHITPMTILKVEKPLQDTTAVGGAVGGGNEVVDVIIPHQEGIRYKTMGTKKADGSTFVAAVTASLSKTDIFQDLFAGSIMSLAAVKRYSSSMGVSKENPLKLAIVAGFMILTTKAFKDTKQFVYSFMNVTTGQELINITYHNTKSTVSVASNFISGLKDLPTSIKRVGDYISYSLGASALLAGGAMLYNATSKKRKKNPVDTYGPPALLFVGGTGLILSKQFA